MAVELTAAQQCQLQLKAETMWNDSQALRDMNTAELGAAKLIASNSVNSVEEIKRTNRKDTDKVRVTWINTCDTNTQDCGDTCTVTGEPDQTVDYKDYELTLCKSSKPIVIDDNDMKGLTYTKEEFFAKQFFNRKLALDKWVNQKVLEFVSVSAGHNKAPQLGNLVGTVEQVASAQYKADLMKAMYREAMLNNIGSPMVLDSGNLWDFLFDAELGKDDCCGSKNTNISKLLNVNFDLTGFAESGIMEDTFLIGRGSYAFHSKSYNPDKPTMIHSESSNHTIYRVMSDHIPGMYYDVTYVFECAGKNTYIHKWQLHAYPFFALNPEGCADVDGKKVSGILAYKKVA